MISDHELSMVSENTIGLNFDPAVGRQVPALLDIHRMRVKHLDQQNRLPFRVQDGNVNAPLT